VPYTQNVEISYAEISEIRNFIVALNSARESKVVVEGKRDSAALQSLGYAEKTLEFHRFGGITRFADSASRHKNLIILLDFDRKGKYLTRRIIEQLGRRTRVDLSYKKKLAQITNGRLRTIEELSRYEFFVNDSL
jgi:5S rRNA maturation endonuclease (ribonuclease M5)